MTHPAETVRLATAADLPVVARWITSATACAQWAGWRVSFPIDLDALPDAIEFTDDNAWCVERGGRVVAFGQLVRKSDRRGHLARIIVSPVARGKGHGETLVRALIDRGRDAGFPCLSLNVAESNAPALALYRKLGFVEAMRPSDEPPAVGSCYMERSV